MIMIAKGFTQLSGPAVALGKKSISLDVNHLPYYAGRSVFRMFAAISLAILITFLLGALAAKSRFAERIIIPVIDVLQSIPVLAFLQISVFLSVQIFPHKVLGIELAAIIAVFVAQAWNMILSFYQSVKSVPYEYYEMAKVLRLTNWKVFWKIEVPSARPGLIFNAMLSLSASWFAVVEAEVIQVHQNKVYLPGIGSYIKVAQDQGNLWAIFYAMMTMLIVIVVYDQIIFRPMQAWVARYENTVDDSAHHWILSFLSKTAWVRKISMPTVFRKYISYFIQIVSTAIIFYGSYHVLLFLTTLTMPELPFKHIDNWWLGTDKIIILFKLGLISACRILLVLILCLLIWVPIGVYIGKNHRLAKWMQPIIQVLAAFPPNVLYPMMMYIIISYQLNIEIWVFPLIMFAAQWYILFNTIAGMMVIPREYILVAKSLHCSQILIWQKVYLPAIMPYLVTGLMTAAGAAWNATIMAELFSWDGHTVAASGLGAYMKQASELGNSLEVAWSVIIMGFLVMMINVFVWQPLYQIATHRFMSKE